MTSTRLVGVKGMNDILPDESGRWQRLEELVASWARSYGYAQIRTPILEPTALFSRGLGQVTDIVEKEMYSFEDSLNGEHLTLRPEMTAGVVRAVIEHNLLHAGPRRLWYLGPMFRHERPQRGRYRQFHQIGAEALGFAGPDVDVEVIAMCQRLWDDLGLRDISLQINSIGDSAERARHRSDLIAHFEKYQDSLDEDGRRRLQSNPLRILDSKNPAMQPIIEAAPQLLDYLETPAREHFEGLRAGLADLGIPARINPRLVRGMDYYNRTVFEWVTDKLGAQATVCGGGRYDPLVEMLGGRSAPSCGFAIGVERLLDLAAQAGAMDAESSTDVYVVSSGAGTASAALRASEQMRAAGLDVLMHAGGGSFKSQFKRADASGATLALVIGEDELARGEFGLKWLRAGGSVDSTDLQARGRQQAVPVDRLVETVVAALTDEEEG
ncbi:MAG TPA: histidine--tRNA ligase [Lautropia sp.]|jgi:histidyl-tRNA synthetase|nr:histidine--tRNA ligase [Lautropia sp.]